MRIIKATPEGLAVAEALAKATGLKFDSDYATANAHRVLTLYFEDVARATAPRFDAIRMAEFTQTRIAAYASLEDPDDPYVHIDQRFDSWLLGMTHLWAMRAFHVLTGENLVAFNTLMRMVLDIKSDPLTHETVRDDMVHVFAQYGEALRVAHELSVAGTVFVVCHELAHHELGHFNQPPSHHVEFEADHRAYELMREVYGSARPLQTIHRQPYSMVGGWVVLTLFDLSERRRAQRMGLCALPRNETHPPAAERLARLTPLLAAEPRPHVKAFMNGFGLAMDDIIADAGLQ